MKLSEIKDPKLAAKIQAQMAAEDRLAKDTNTALDLITKPKKRIRQNPKPLLNELESRFYRKLVLDERFDVVWPQALKFRLGNGCHYCPDFAVWSSGEEFPLSCYEVKGKHAWDDALVKIKVAASEYQYIKWFLVWEESHQWCEQEVLP